ncbi:MAG TPA: sugar phosphate isomerase/epimerase family protein [Solirubrobacterales bacterium]|nr:sugar phosphate isomerase/epimerase family protein [Solirubrobacterales bacterium]
MSSTDSLAASTDRYAVNSYSTPHNSSIDDIEQIARTGGRGVGLWEGKFADGEDAAIAQAMTSNGLRASFCVPAVHTILPVPFNAPGIPSDPEARTEAILDSIPRLAVFDPLAIVIGPGVSGDPAHPIGPVEAIAEALPRIADAAAEHGQVITFELLAERRGSPLHNLPMIAGFLDEIGRPDIGIMFDVYHSWCEPDLHDHIRQYAKRINSVHVNDVQPEERTNFDRAMPGEGRGVAAEIIATLIEAGYDGWWELEVFSDDGTYGTEFPDSLWKMPHEEFLAKGKAAFDRTYAEAVTIVERRASRS